MKKREDPKILPPGEDGFNPMYGARCTVREKLVLPFFLFIIQSEAAVFLSVAQSVEIGVAPFR